MKYTQLIAKITDYLDNHQIGEEQEGCLRYALKAFRYESQYCKSPDTSVLKDLAKYAITTIKN